MVWSRTKSDPLPTFGFKPSQSRAELKMFNALRVAVMNAMYKDKRTPWLPVLVAFLATTIGQCALGHGDHSQDGPSPILHSNPHFYVPKDLISLLRETQDQVSKWEKAIELCTPVHPSQPLESSCMAALSKYFMDAPVWDYGSLYYIDSYGFGRADPFPVNPRPALLSYGPADYELQDAPRWHDIFDGKIEQRKGTFFEVVEDPTCRAIMHGGIREEMGNHCQAREMYKYAAYLDACATAMRRLKVLNRATGRSGYKGLSTYEMTLQVVKEKIGDIVQQDMIRQRIQKGYLHASWVAHQCEPHGLALLPLKEEQKWTLGGGYAELVEVGSDSATRWAVGHSNFVAMNIASRCGDEWAIRSCALTPDDPEFLQDVYDQYPILYHRHLGSSLGGDGGGFSRVEQRRHQAKAYLLLKQSLGTRIAQLSYDETDLKEEIEYVQKGGKLTLLLQDKVTPNGAGSVSGQRESDGKAND